MPKFDALSRIGDRRGVGHGRLGVLTAGPEGTIDPTARVAISNSLPSATRTRRRSSATVTTVAKMPPMVTMSVPAVRADCISACSLRRVR